MQPFVVISVLNWNSPNITTRCIESLEQLTYHQTEIVIVDNASTDESVEHIQQQHPDITLIESQRNLGYAAGNHHALRYARQHDAAQLLWIVNNDTVVEPDALSQLINAYQDHGEALYGSVPLHGGAQREERNVTFVPRSLTSAWQKFKYLTNQGITYDELFDDTQAQPVHMLSGSSLLVPLTVVAQHGFIKRSFFMYGEDIEYCHHLNGRGVPSYIVPRSIVRHENNGSSSDSPRLKAVMTYYLVRNRLRVMSRHERRWMTTGLVIKDMIWLMIYLMMVFKRGINALYLAYYTLLALRDALLRRTGKTLDPDDYVA